MSSPEIKFPWTHISLFQAQVGLRKVWDIKEEEDELWSQFELQIWDLATLAPLKFGLIFLKVYPEAGFN